MQYLEELLGDFSQETSLDVIIGLEEDLSKSRLTEWIILQVESIEALERVAICLHISSDVDAKSRRGLATRTCTSSVSTDRSYGRRFSD